MKKVIRIKANKTFKKSSNIQSEMHTDVKRKDDEKFKTAVFYCNTNNGSMSLIHISEPTRPERSA